MFMFFFALFCFSLISVLVAMLGSKVSCFGVIIFLIWVLYAWCLFSVVLCMCSLSKEATDVPKERRHKKGLENTKAWRPARPVKQHTTRAGWMLPYKKQGVCTAARAGWHDPCNKVWSRIIFEENLGAARPVQDWDGPCRVREQNSIFCVFLCFLDPEGHCWYFGLGILPRLFKLRKEKEKRTFCKIGKEDYTEEHWRNKRIHDGEIQGDQPLKIIVWKLIVMSNFLNMSIFYNMRG